ncbi:TIGR02757 family protein [Flavobacterium sp.]
MDGKDLKDFLDEKVVQYNNKSFIDFDPIQIPHQYTLKEDIEISGFLVATLAWGKRMTIIQKSEKLMSLLGNSPYDFILNHTQSDLEKLHDFTHRTFNGVDCQFFIKSLHNIYTNHSGLENIFTINQGETQMHESIVNFRTLFFQTEHWIRTRKHVSDPSTGAAAKRLHMFLRWMIRHDSNGVDFGLWKNIPMSKLSCPLDVHTGNVSRSLGLIDRKQNDIKAVNILDAKLREFDPIDPVKYDFALFGLGAHEGFK